MRHSPALRASARPFALALMAALMLAACGPTPSISVQVGDTSLTVILGGSVSAEVTLTRAGGATADVTLDVDDLPAWVEVSFSPVTLSGGTLTSTMTVQTDKDHPDSQPATVDFTVTATGNGLSAAEEVTLEVELLQVTGRVLEILGAPVTNVSISINGATPIPVEPDGTFVGTEVAIPYDIAMLDVANSFAVVYQGISTGDVTFNTVGMTTQYMTTISGDLSETVGTDQLGIVCVEGIDQVVIGCGSVSTGDTAFSFGAQWFDDPEASVNVRGWIVDLDAGGATTGYPYEGQTALNIENGMAALADVALGSGPSSIEVDVTITPPPGIPLSGGGMLLYHYSAMGSVRLPTGAPSDSFTVALPDVAGTTATVVGSATGMANVVLAWANGDFSSGALDLVMPSAATQLSPADGATGVDHGTVFRIDNPSGGPVSFAFSGPVTYVVSTSGKEVTVPDLSSFGLGLPAASPYTWQIFGWAHLETLDELAQVGWISSLGDLSTMVAGGPAPAPEGALLLTESRSFTTE